MAFEKKTIEFESLEGSGTQPDLHIGTQEERQSESNRQPDSDRQPDSGRQPVRDTHPEDASRRRSRGSSRAGSRGGRGIVLLLALVVFALLAAAVLYVQYSRKKARQAAEEAASIEASIAAEEVAARERAPKYNTLEFAPCDIPELNMLAAEYFEARLSGDTERLAEMFGKTGAAADDELAVKLKTQADWIQSYGNVRVYSVQGLDEDEQLCLVLYDIDFRRTDTLAPGVLYFYARRDADGVYTFVDNPVREIYDYIQAELETESAKALISESNARLKAALDVDSTLALLYMAFRSGEIYREKDIDLDKEQEVGLFVDPEDSILVGDAVLEAIKNEAAEDASIEASLAAEDETE